jgi:NAD(P)-dependent dehydrogenase (short-subunit alcohol dehydrogenase family)
MDLKIRGKTAIVCAASKGLGRGCAEALAENGVDLVLNARGAEALEATAGRSARPPASPSPRSPPTSPPKPAGGPCWTPRPGTPTS